ncbi:MAG: dihydroorotate dehydrogenase [Dehalococcoidia bacterium]|nr:MAG: dihydroorotate dehydrogenase [Dehalococcoidia bacterium]
MVNLTVQLAPRNKRGLLLANPVMTASGTCGYGTDKNYPFEIQRLGAFVCKGTTIEMRGGNSQPRIIETAAGMLNSIGLENIGVDSLIKDKAPIWKKWNIPVIVNIAGETVEDYARLSAALDEIAGVSAIEVNISCPNIKAGGVEFGVKAKSAANVTAAVRKATSLPVIVKLTPNTGNIVEVALAVTTVGADSISLINTLKGMAIDIHRRKPSLGSVTGGLSGPAIKPIALAMVYELATAIEIPLIGCGGIVNSSDAIEFLMAGASAVQIGTTNLVNPGNPIEILEGIESFMSERRIEDVKELIGAAQH